MTELRAVQIEALRRSDGKSGYLWALDMGLGKTLTALVEFKRLQASGEIDKLLVLCPKSVIGTWGDEIKAHGVEIAATDLLVLNFEQVLSANGAKRIKEFIWRQPRVMLVVDESHRLKNFASKSTRWITNELMLRVKVTRCLTGTPLAESPMDLYPQLRLCGATMGANPWTWRAKWCVMGGYLGKVIVAARDPEKLAAFIAPHMFRATKEEWGKDLPERTFAAKKLQMTAVQRQLYQELEQEFCATIGDQEITVAMALTLQVRLAQLGMGFIGSDDGKEVELSGGNPKLDALREYGKQFGVQGRKFIVIVQHQWAAEAAAECLRADGLSVVELHGRSPTSVDEAKAAFNQDDAADCLVGTIRKTGVGLTLMGTARRPCSDMIILQQAFSLIDRLQVVDRIHRIGQRFPCNYLDLVMTPLDEVILASLLRKEDMTNSIVQYLRSKSK